MGLYKKVKREASKPQELDVEKIASQPEPKPPKSVKPLAHKHLRGLEEQVSSIKPLMDTIFEQQKAMMAKLDELVSTDKKVHKEVKKTEDVLERPEDIKLGDSVYCYLGTSDYPEKHKVVDVQQNGLMLIVEGIDNKDTPVVFGEQAGCYVQFKK